MLGKALLNLDEVARTLDPTFDPNAAIQRAELGPACAASCSQAASARQRDGRGDGGEGVRREAPGRVNKVMDALAEGELTLNVQGIDERDIMRGVQKLANRLTSGVVVAVARHRRGADHARSTTSAKLFGYPALAIVLFLVAAAAGVGLLVSIQLSDLPQRKRR